MGGALGRMFFRGDSFIVRASCSADPDKRVHSISISVISSLWGRTNDPRPRPAPAGVWGVAVSSSIGSREEHITLYFNINPYFNKSKSVWKHLWLQYMYTDNAH